MRCGGSYRAHDVGKIGPFRQINAVGRDFDAGYDKLAIAFLSSSAAWRTAASMGRLRTLPRVYGIMQ